MIKCGFRCIKKVWFQVYFDVSQVLAIPFFTNKMTGFKKKIFLPLNFSLFLSLFNETNCGFSLF